MCISAVLGVGSALIGSSSSKKAAQAQQASAQAQVDLSREIYEDQKQRFEPFYSSGTNALDALMFEMGLGPRPTFGGTPQEVNAFTQFSDGTTGPAGATAQAAPTGPGFWTGRGDNAQFIRFGGGNNTPTGTEMFRVGDRTFSSREEADDFARANPIGGTAYGGFQKQPGYDFRMREGVNALESGAAARGGLYSGSTMRSLQNFGQDYATSMYDTFINRLTGMAGAGQAAAGNQAAAGANFASNANNAFANMGNAQAAGAIGAGNAWQNALGGLAGMVGYQNAQPGSAGTLPFGSSPMTSIRPMARPF
jgi:hypothetical protein